MGASLCAPISQVTCCVEYLIFICSIGLGILLGKSIYPCKQVLCSFLTKILEICVVVDGLIVDITLSKCSFPFIKFQN